MDDFADFDREVEQASGLLPAWFVPRMMTDEWSFAFIMVNGDIVHLTHIEEVHLGADGIWFDVRLAEHQNWQGPDLAGRHITAPTTRTMASINARHIVMAFETAYT